LAFDRCDVCTTRSQTLHNLNTHAQVLSLGPRFDQFLGDLPATLQELSFLHKKTSDGVFCQPLGPLPSRLKVLDFSGNDSFNVPLGELPQSLTYLHTSCRFNNPLEPLPSTLRVLTLGSGFSHSIDAAPATLDELSVWNDEYSHPLPPLPGALRLLLVCYNGPLGLLPPNLHELCIFSDVYDYPLGPLPGTLAKLTLPLGYEIPLEGARADLIIERTTV
jgi:hypothetical protein